MKKIFIFCLFLFSMIAVIACDHHGTPTEYEPCTGEYDQRCFENTTQICKAGKWEDVEDCGSLACAIVVIDDIADAKCISF